MLYLLPIISIVLFGERIQWFPWRFKIFSKKGRWASIFPVYFKFKWNWKNEYNDFKPIWTLWVYAYLFYCHVCQNNSCLTVNFSLLLGYKTFVHIGNYVILDMCWCIDLMIVRFSQKSWLQKSIYFFWCNWIWKACALFLLWSEQIWGGKRIFIF